MTTNILVYLVFLNLLFTLSSIHELPLHQAFASGRRFILHEANSIRPPPPDGMCSYAIAVHGFKCQEYSVTTDDGYILSLQRIPEGRRGGGDGNEQRQPVLLQHGLLVDGKCWLENSPEQSLAFMLADNGFDVWISNFRGTRFSRRHVYLDPDHPNFWNWTWAELASHDIPSVIDFVFKETGKQIHYVGHSMGTMVALTLLSEGKFGNVKSAALLSPIAHLSHTTSPLAIYGADSFFGELGESVGLEEFNLKNLFGINFIKQICTRVDCSDLLIAISGNDCCLNKTIIENFIGNDTQSTSTKNLVHFAQNVRCGILAAYDYGPIVNFVKYGAILPPVYNLSKIALDFPLLLSYGGRDALSDVADVAILLNSLKAHDQDKLQVKFIPQYAHVDFVMGVDANDLVYKQIIDFFTKFN